MAAPAPTEWYRDQFFISTKTSLIQPSAVNAAFGSDLVYWAKAIEDESLLVKMLEKSLCFGVYELPSSSSDIAGRANPRQIGLARLITDEVSFAYLTDVYILQEFAGKGLGTWLIQCVDETLSLWPELRRVMLITSKASMFYQERLSVKKFEEGTHGMAVFTRKGPGSPMSD